jgi:hypothetical protein
LLKNSSGSDMGGISYYPSNYGTATQQNTVTIASVSNQKLGIQANAGGGGSAQDIWFSNKGGQFNAYLFSTGNFTLQNGGTFTDAGYRLDVVGTARVSGAATFLSNVGINTTSPSSQLHIAGSTDNAFTDGLRVSRQSTLGQYVSLNYAGGIVNFIAVDTVGSTPQIGFYTSTNGTSGTERMRITSTGNVGIGTSSPSSLASTTNLIVRGTSAGATALIQSLSSDGGCSIGLYSGASASDDGAILYQKNLRFGSVTDVGLGGFAERMRITSGGNVCIGMTTSPYGRVSIKSNSATIYAGFGIYAASNENFTLLNHDGNVGYIGCDSTATGFATPLAFWINSAIRITMSTNGSIGAPSGTNIYNASDARLKKNISTTTYGLDAISALNPVKFNWVDGFEPSEDGKDMLGFVAQEVQQVIPEAIESFGGNSITIGDTTIDNPLRVNEKFIIPVLVKAIQEQQVQIEELKTLLKA